VSGNEDAREREAKEAHSKLDEGLKSCRAVVSNYRALLNKKPRTPAAQQKNKGSTG
jgi:hypothetical protein